jgi:ribosomal protein S18 acetylase RimI-like enzyme
VSDDRRFEIRDVADGSDIDELRERLLEYNFATTGHRDGRSLSCFVRDDDGVMVAGIDGFTWGGYAKVDLLWVDERQRGRGLGSALLDAAEGEARRRGCRVVRVDTHSFQAPDFYRRRGFETIGEVAGTPEGHAEHFFVKRLEP